MADFVYYIDWLVEYLEGTKRKVKLKLILNCKTQIHVIISRDVIAFIIDLLQKDINLKIEYIYSE
jgi:hypothetical protein